ncbi:MAG: ABC transporter permease [Lentisphaerae bacterium]|nr:ABC transporter permease [Lentisphaerota bacterium]
MADNTTRQTAGAAAPVREQVILPWPVAIRITLRGLKIRLGRALITMSGVVLGIAFLMSVLTGERLKLGLAEETRTKTEVARLVKLVEDEIGSIPGRRLGIVVSASPSERHLQRLLERLAAQADPGAMPVFCTRTDRLEAAPNAKLDDLFSRPAFKRVDTLEDLFRDSHVVLLLSPDLPLPSPADMVPHLQRMRQPVLLDYFVGRYREADLRALDERVVYASLSYVPGEEEAARLAKRHHDQAARQMWITVVSILVTVIGISNAMLMSVTERIREIGTMKCLGALSGFVVKLFLVESFLIGVLGAIIGTLLGFVVPLLAYMLSAGVGLVMASAPFATLALCGLGSVLVGTALAIVAAIYPAVVAARMVPADALRTNV